MYLDNGNRKSLFLAYTTTLEALRGKPRPSSFIPATILKQGKSWPGNVICTLFQNNPNNTTFSYESLITPPLSPQIQCCVWDPSNIVSRGGGGSVFFQGKSGRWSNLLENVVLFSLSWKRGSCRVSSRETLFVDSIWGGKCYAYVQKKDWHQNVKYLLHLRSQTTFITLGYCRLSSVTVGTLVRERR